MLGKELINAKLVYPEQSFYLQAEQSIDVYINNSLILSVPANTTSGQITVKHYDEIWIHSQGDPLLFPYAGIIAAGYVELLSKNSGIDIRFRFVKSGLADSTTLTLVIV